jgi:drug/metabolite transporter (DMT)-like permease
VPQPGPVAAPLIGIAFIVVAQFVFVASDTIAKHLADEMSIVQVLWARYTFHALFLVAVTRPRAYRRLVWTRRPRLQIARSVSVLISSSAFYVALAYIPIATAGTISFTWPLLVTAMSVPLLGEKVGIRRWTAVCAGFVGVIVVMQPGAGILHWAVFMPLITALFYGLYQVLTRKVSGTDSPMTSLFYTAAVGALALNVAVPFYWTSPSLTEWVMMAGLGGCIVVGQFFVIRALALASASTLAPYGYVYLIGIALAGYLVFGNPPGLNTVIGGGIIAASGLFILFRERTLARQARDAGGTP